MDNALVHSSVSARRLALRYATRFSRKRTCVEHLLVSMPQFQYVLEVSSKALLHDDNPVSHTYYGLKTIGQCAAFATETKR